MPDSVRACRTLGSPRWVQHSSGFRRERCSMVSDTYLADVDEPVSGRTCVLMRKYPPTPWPPFSSLHIDSQRNKRHLYRRFHDRLYPMSGLFFLFFGSQHVHRVVDGHYHPALHPKVPEFRVQSDQRHSQDVGFHQLQQGCFILPALSQLLV